MSSETTEETKVEAPKPKSRRRRRLLIALSIVFVLYVLGGFFGVPLLMRHVALPMVNDLLNGTASVERFACNPFRLSIRIENAKVVDTAGNDVAGFATFEGNAEIWQTMFKSGIRFLKANVEGLFVVAQINSAGELNLATLVKPSEKAEKSKPTESWPHVIVDILGLDDATIKFVDESNAERFSIALQGVTLRADGFDSRPDHDNGFNLTATTPEGETISGSGVLRLDPLTLTGDLSLAKLGLARFEPYVGAFAEPRVEAGEADVEVSFDFAPLAEPRRALIEVKKMAARDLKLTHNGQELASVPTAMIETLRIDAVNRAIALTKLSADSPRAVVVRNADGTFAAETFVKAVPTVEPVEEYLESQTVGGEVGEKDLINRLIVATDAILKNLEGEWSVISESIEITNADVALIDRTLASENRIEVESVNVTAGATTSDDGFRTPVQLNGAFKAGGRFAVNGEVQAEPTRAKLSVDADEIALAAIRAYIPSELPEPLPASTLSDGKAHAKGELSLNVDGTTVKVDWTGQAGLDTLKLDPIDGGETVASVAAIGTDGTAGMRIESNGLWFDWNGTVRVNEVVSNVSLAGPVNAAVKSVAIDGTLSSTLDMDSPDNLAAVFEGKVEVADASGKAPEQFHFDGGVGVVRLEDLRLDLAQRSIQARRIYVDRPVASVAFPITPADESAVPADAGGEKRDVEIVLPIALCVDEFELTNGSTKLVDPDSHLEATADELTVRAEGISNDGQTTSSVKVGGRLQGSGRFEGEGKVDLFRPLRATEFMLKLAAVPIKPYQPVVGPVLGHEIDSGRLNLELPVKVESGQLVGEVKANLDRFYLGGEMKSEQSLDLPVKLGLTLLRDANEQIDANMGVKGDLTDPSFNVGGVVWKAITNLLTKAATAPFQLIGAAFNAGDRDLSQVTFEAGSAELPAEMISTLDILARAMNQRPGIKLRAVGSASLEIDGPAIRKAMFEASMLEEARQRNSDLTEVPADRHDRQARARYEKEVGRLDPNMSTEAIVQTLVDRVEVPAEALRDLAERRARRVIELLKSDGGIAEDRLEATVPENVGEGAAAVEFEIG